jgi:hypothetical protein
MISIFAKSSHYIRNNLWKPTESVDAHDFNSEVFTGFCYDFSRMTSPRGGRIRALACEEIVCGSFVDRPLCVKRLWMADGSLLHKGPSLHVSRSRRVYLSGVWPKLCMPIRWDKGQGCHVQEMAVGM